VPQTDIVLNAAHIILSSYSAGNESSGDRGGDQAGGNQNKGNNLHVSSLSFRTNDESLRREFEKYGPVVSATLVKDSFGESRGFGFVTMEDVESGDRAIEAMHGREFEGRVIKVERAKRSTGYEKTPGRYLGPPQLSTKYNNRDDRRGGYDRRDDRRGGGYRDEPYRGGGGGGGYRDDRGGYRDDRGGYRDRYDDFYRGPPGGGGRDYDDR
jgi:RNA recognition motif-containing protein